jgi:hypothetical protein
MERSFQELLKKEFLNVTGLAEEEEDKRNNNTRFTRTGG